MNTLINIALILVILCGLYLVSPVSVKSKIDYRLQYWRRQLWIAFGRCPRCNCPVNFDRNNRAHCPQCGRPC